MSGLGGLASPSNILATGGASFPVGGIWDESDLVGGVGRITILMDVNWFTIARPANHLDNIENIQTFLETKAVMVSEPGTLAIMVLGLAGLGFARRRKAA